MLIFEMYESNLTALSIAFVIIAIILLIYALFPDLFKKIKDIIIMPFVFLKIFFVPEKAYGDDWKEREERERRLS
jgi:hypothetical protein